MDRVDSGVLTDDILANQAFQGSAAVEDDGFRGRGFMLKARFELDDYVLAVWRQDVVVAVFNEKKFSEFECSVGVPDSMLPILPLSLRVYCLKDGGHSLPCLQVAALVEQLKVAGGLFAQLVGRLGLCVNRQRRRDQNESDQKPFPTEPAHLSPY